MRNVAAAGLAVLAFTAGSLTNCDENHRTVVLRYSGVLAKPVPAIDKGDTVRWRNANDSGSLSAHFPVNHSPCKHHETDVTECEVQSDGFFPYACNNCTGDPYVPVGKEGGKGNEGQHGQPSGGYFYNPLGVYCFDPGNGGALTAEIPDQTVVLNNGATSFEWRASGTPGIDLPTKWTLSSFSANVCGSATFTGTDHVPATCNITTRTPNKYTYQVTASVTLADGSTKTCNSASSTLTLETR
jgi:hypothetical protein